MWRARVCFQALSRMILKRSANWLNTNCNQFCEDMKNLQLQTTDPSGGMCHMWRVLPSIKHNDFYREALVDLLRDYNQPCVDMNPINDILVQRYVQHTRVCFQASSWMTLKEKHQLIQHRLQELCVDMRATGPYTSKSRWYLLFACIITSGCWLWSDYYSQGS